MIQLSLCNDKFSIPNIKQNDLLEDITQEEQNLLKNEIHLQKLNAQVSISKIIYYKYFLVPH